MRRYCPDSSHPSGPPHLPALGIDIGSVGVKAALLDADGKLAGTWSRTVSGRPGAALESILADVARAAAPAQIRLGLTGGGQDLVRGGGRSETAVVALARAVPVICPAACTAIEIGAHAACVVFLDPVTRGMADYGLNLQCAAGSGAFFEQQAGRLGVAPTALAAMAAQAPRGATIAGRCSVFAKSDMIHLQQKGTPVAEIAYGLCLAMARNFVATILRGREARPPVLLAGGCALNAGVARAFRDVLGVPSEEVLVSPCPGLEGAIGAALAAWEDHGRPPLSWAAVTDALTLAPPSPEEALAPPLQVQALPPPVSTAPPDGTLEAYLGVDVGSVSTNLVLLAVGGEVVESIYLPTRGQPVDALADGLDRIRSRFGERLRILGAGVTGSGRHLAAHLLGADVVRNEITCQLRGALAIDPEVDTIFEIGGQDSKFIAVDGGRIADFTMNKICAAGTGSFLEEQADHLGIAIVDEFSRLAAASASPANLGCQCTVFMHSELVAAEQRGVGLPDLCAGLAIAVARNYLERVVAGRRVGCRVMFQGGVAGNAAVVAAFRGILGVPVRVHPHAGVSGAIGAALLAREARPVRTAFRGLDLERDVAVQSFECPRCANRCQVNRFRIHGQTVHFGDACERYSSRAAETATAAIPDPLARLQDIERSYLATPDPARGCIGIPRASALFDMLPFWTPFFTSLGFEAVISSPSSPETLQAGLRRLPAETCLPIKLAFGHVQELAAKGVERIFLPSILKRQGDDPRLSHSCPYAQAVPYMVRAAIPAAFLSPEVDLSAGEEAFVQGVLPVLRDLGCSRPEVVRAYHEGVAAWDDYHDRLVALGGELLGGADWAVVVLGKPYNVLDPFLNLNLFQHLRRLGVVALPMWCLPRQGGDAAAAGVPLPWHSNRAILQAARQCVGDPRLFPVLVSNFGCGPDAFTQEHARAVFAGRPSLLLEFDEHRAEAGLITRLEAFLDEIGAFRGAGGNRTDMGTAALRPGVLTSQPAAPADGPYILPYFTDHVHVFAGALRAIGRRTRILPPATPEIRLLGESHSSGKECHPYSILAGDLINLARSPRQGNEVFFFPGTSVPCLLHQYGEAHRMLLQRLGVADLQVMTPRFADLRELFGIDVGARLWRGLVAVDLLIKMVCETRPYELEAGQTDEVHRQNLRDIETAVATDELSAALTMATSRLRLIPADRSIPRPLIGVAGDIFTRISPVGNQDLFAWLEAHGCEVWPAPFIVDITDFAMRRQWAKQSFGEAALLGALMLRKNVESWRVRRMFRGQVKHGEEPGFQEVLDLASPYLGPEQNEVLLLNVAKMVDFARRGADGILNAVCFNCMLGTVSVAITGRVRDDHGGIPVASLTYSGISGSQRPLLEAFLHQVGSFAVRRSGPTPAAPPREKGLLARFWPGSG